LRHQGLTAVPGRTGQLDLVYQIEEATCSASARSTSTSRATVRIRARTCPESLVAATRGHRGYPGSASERTALSPASCSFQSDEGTPLRIVIPADLAKPHLWPKANGFRGQSPDSNQAVQQPRVLWCSTSSYRHSEAISVIGNRMVKAQLSNTNRRTTRRGCYWPCGWSSRQAAPGCRTPNHDPPGPRCVVTWKVRPRLLQQRPRPRHGHAPVTVRARTTGIPI